MVLLAAISGPKSLTAVGIAVTLSLENALKRLDKVRRRSFTLDINLGATLSLMALLTTSLFSQTPSIPGIPWDWSHERLIFSTPSNAEERARIQQDSRYWHQTFHRAGMARGGSGSDLDARKPEKDRGLWGQTLGSGSPEPTVGALNYPAKYSFSTGTAPTTANCAAGATPDYVAFNTSVLGSSTQATVVAFDNLYASTCSGTVPQTYWAYDTGGTVATSVVLSANGSQIAFMQTVSGAAGLVVLSWSATGGAFLGSTTSASKSVTVTSGTCNLVLAGEPIFGPGIPAADTIASCTGTTLMLSANATATASNQPLTFTNQFTGTTSSGSTSITVPSCTPFTVGAPIYGAGIPQGDTVASCSSTTLKLVTAASASHTSEIITFNPATAVAPGILASNSSYPSCTAPCMISVPFGDGKNDTSSSPFYDYSADTLYVGDGSGNLHKFNPVFNGTPKEVTTSPWPVGVSANVLTSPVFDFGTGDIFVADSGGFLYSYNPSGTLTGNSSQLARTGSKGIVDSPLVDSIAGTVYVFVGDDGNTTTTHLCDVSTGCNGVFRFSTTSFITSTGNTTSTCTSSNGTSWATGTNCGAESIFGVGNTSTILYDGTFDNAYYTSNPAGSAGNLYACAATGTPGPKLAYVPIGDFGSVLSIAVNTINPMTSAAASCSPVTESYNGTTDFIFASVTQDGNVSIASGGDACTGACVYTFNVTTAPATCSPTCSFQATSGLAASGGASGMIIDNTESSGQIYFSYLLGATTGIACPSSGSVTSGGCAVQASQTALK
jgi:hypothetical protein